ncbi:MAG: HEPN domain-containing protein [Nitrospinae bacterium]|nr:HEPN domain-containing protein [Nitrospinota bacterium]MBI3815204.1 HEPN domain-containing protein [Nitrospinota bacterium]
MLKFDVEKTVQYWLAGAEYDMDVAVALYEKEKFPYSLFMGHLAVEKLLKALVVKTTREQAPYTHSLALLAGMLPIEFPSETIDKLARFMEFHFEARYPEEQHKFYEKCTYEFSKGKLQEIKEVFVWLKEKL